MLDTENVEIFKEEKYYKGVCQCQMYEWNSQRIGKIGVPTTKPLEYCDKFSGFSPDSTGAIYKFQEEVRLWLLRNKR